MLKVNASGATKEPRVRRLYRTSTTRKVAAIASAKNESDSNRLVMGVGVQGRGQSRDFPRQECGEYAEDERERSDEGTQGPQVVPDLDDEKGGGDRQREKRKRLEQIGDGGVPGNRIPEDEPGGVKDDPDQKQHAAEARSPFLLRDDEVEVEESPGKIEEGGRLQQGYVHPAILVQEQGSNKRNSGRWRGDTWGTSPDFVLVEYYVEECPPPRSGGNSPAPMTRAARDRPHGARPPDPDVIPQKPGTGDRVVRWRT